MDLCGEAAWVEDSYDYLPWVDVSFRSRHPELCDGVARFLWEEQSPDDAVAEARKAGLLDDTRLRMTTAGLPARSEYRTPTPVRRYNPRFA